MLSRVTTFAIDGLDTRQVWVEVDIRQGLPGFTVVGLGDAAVRESRERVRAAILNSGFEFPQRRITANLAPASLRKVGPGFDLALAVAVLAASGQVDPRRLESLAVFGELSLTGATRPCHGTLAVAEGAQRAGLEGLVVALERATEARLVEGLCVSAIGGLADVPKLLAGELVTAHVSSAAPPSLADPFAPDIADVRGQLSAIRALTIAATGGHNLLMVGPPGTGKTMLARRLPSLLPPLEPAAALEVTRIHSIAGLHEGGGLISTPPFRAPHHTISPAGLVGGGSVPTPGETTLAHRGVLFLDELTEFSRSSLEALRQPLEDGRIVVVRRQRAAVYPTRFQLVAATNPCPCGFAGSPRCQCPEAELSRYRRRLSGPLLDRIDLLVGVTRPHSGELSGVAGESSQVVQARVVEARERQSRRQSRGLPARNCELEGTALEQAARLTHDAERVLARAYERGTLSARAHHRVTKVARTVADLAGRDRVDAPDIRAALGFRTTGARPDHEQEGTG